VTQTPIFDQLAAELSINFSGPAPVNVKPVTRHRRRKLVKSAQEIMDAAGTKQS
jgi:hypothetical protein